MTVLYSANAYDSVSPKNAVPSISEAINSIGLAFMSVRGGGSLIFPKLMLQKCINLAGAVNRLTGRSGRANHFKNIR